MARAHASGIRVRAPSAPDLPSDEPRVVLSVETNPRKVPTHKRILDGRDPSAGGGRAALLPGTPSEAASPAKAQAASDRPAAATTVPRPLEPLPRWMRIALAAVLLLLMAGIVRRTRHWLAAREAAPLPPPAADVAPPQVVIIEAPPVTAAPVSPPPPPPEESTPKPPPKVAKDVVASTAPHDNTPRAPKPAPPKPAFSPPFELPAPKK